MLDGNGNPRIFCHSVDTYMERPISKCNTYDEAGSMRRHEMEEIAWIIQPDRTGPIGFVRPGTEEHRKLLRDY